MFAGLFQLWLIFPILGAGAFLATIIYMLVSNHKMKKEFHRNITQ